MPIVTNYFKFIKYYNLCTDLHPDVIVEIERRLANGENPRNVKMELAHEITKLYPRSTFHVKIIIKPLSEALFDVFYYYRYIFIILTLVYD